MHRLVAGMGVVRLRGCPYAPIHFYVPIHSDAPICLYNPHMSGCPLYVWIPAIHLDAPCMSEYPQNLYAPMLPCTSVIFLGGICIWYGDGGHLYTPCWAPGWCYKDNIQKVFHTYCLTHCTFDVVIIVCVLVGYLNFFVGAYKHMGVIWMPLSLTILYAYL